MNTSYLPGTLTIAPGTRDDYLALERFHYLPRRPATFAQILTARYIPREPCGPNQARPVAVAVLSWPVPHAGWRNRYFGLKQATMRDKLRFANAHVRTISRVIVHPQFRGIGLATALIHRLLHDCPTRYVEAMARMGRAHPMFERAGMMRIDTSDDGPLYYLHDRLAGLVSLPPERKIADLRLKKPAPSRLTDPTRHILHPFFPARRSAPTSALRRKGKHALFASSAPIIAFE